MANTKHTPGPWRIDPDFNRDVQTADGAHEIATAEYGKPLCTDADYSVPQDFDEAIANARLMAAAPDLLAALQMARSLMVTVNNYSTDGASIRVIDSAIAKATGEQQ